jgi:hypothetical protein
MAGGNSWTSSAPRPLDPEAYFSFKGNIDLTYEVLDAKVGARKSPKSASRVV